jgi:hypothetical protein
MTHKKLRRSGRISKSVPILLIGSDTGGRVFSEVTHTVALSLHGAGVVSSHKLLAEQELVLRSLVNNREAEVRVAGEIAEQGDKHTYGVAFATARWTSGGRSFLRRLRSRSVPWNFRWNAQVAAIGDRGEWRLRV